MTRRARIRAGVGLGVVASIVLACTATLQGGVALITGPDDGFAQNPQPTRLRFQLITDGQATTVATTSLPTMNGVAIPPESSATIDTLQVTGFDEAGDAVVSGSTIPLSLDQLSGITLNLFVQRTGQFSRLPSGDGGTALLAFPASTKPILTTVYSRYLLISDGTGKSATTQLYDTLNWQVLPAPPPLPINPLSVAYLAGYTGSDAAADATASFAALLTLGQDGASSWLDLTDSVSAEASVTFEASVPDGGSFSAVAGGQSVIDSDDGSVYIVGATRQTGAPTKAILHVTSTGVLQALSLSVARLGAAATYVPTQGLFVFGGNAETDGGAAVAGAEVLPNGTAVATALPGIPADTTTGAGAVALDSTSILLAGGVTAKGASAPVRLYSVAGVTGNTPTVEAGAPPPALPVTLAMAQVFALQPTRATSGWSAMVVGSEASGATSAYEISARAVTAVPFRVPRSHAEAIVLPNGSIGLVGGDATTLESFIP
jgi:hypothetical protein